MSNLYRLVKVQIERLRPYFTKIRGRACVDDHHGLVDLFLLIAMCYGGVMQFSSASLQRLCIIVGNARVTWVYFSWIMMRLAEQAL